MYREWCVFEQRMWCVLVKDEGSGLSQAPLLCTENVVVVCIENVVCVNRECGVYLCAWRMCLCARRMYVMCLCVH